MLNASCPRPPVVSGEMHLELRPLTAGKFFSERVVDLLPQVLIDSPRKA